MDQELFNSYQRNNGRYRHPWTTVKGRGELLVLDKLGYNFVEVWLCVFGKYEPMEIFRLLDITIKEVKGPISHTIIMSKWVGCDGFLGTIGNTLMQFFPDD